MQQGARNQNKHKNQKQSPEQWHMGVQFGHGIPSALPISQKFPLLLKGYAPAPISGHNAPLP